MNSWILVTLLIGVFAVIVGVIVFYIMLKKQKEGTVKDPDYRAFFIMGISFLPIGIIFTTTISPAFISFIALGVLYMLIGLSNRDKWKKKEK